MKKVGFSLFNISPARSTFSKKCLTFPQLEAHNPPKKVTTREMLKIDLCKPLTLIVNPNKKKLIGTLNPKPSFVNPIKSKP